MNNKKTTTIGDYIADIKLSTLDVSSSSETLTIVDISDVSCAGGLTFVTHDGTLKKPDPYQELEDITLERERDEQLRDEYPVLQEAHENYELIKKLLEDHNIDKTFDTRYRDFIKK